MKLDPVLTRRLLQVVEERAAIAAALDPAPGIVRYEAGALFALGT